VQSFPFLNSLDEAFRSGGLQVVAINVDQNSGDARRFLDRHSANFLIAFDHDGKCPREFGVQGMPSSYVIDRQGVIRYVHLGFRRGDADKLRGIVAALLAESVAPQ
jgi:peroxiredoxin